MLQNAKNTLPSFNAQHTGEKNCQQTTFSDFFSFFFFFFFFFFQKIRSETDSVNMNCQFLFSKKVRKLLLIDSVNSQVKCKPYLVAQAISFLFSHLVKFINIFILGYSWDTRKWVLKAKLLVTCKPEYQTALSNGFIVMRMQQLVSFIINPKNSFDHTHRRKFTYCDSFVSHREPSSTCNIDLVMSRITYH